MPEATSARLCPQCREVRRADQFRPRHGKCKACSNAVSNACRARQMDRDRLCRARVRAGQVCTRNRQNDRTRPAGPRRSWTSDELAVILRPDVSHLDAAQMLERSYSGIQMKRSKLWRALGLPEPIRLHAKTLRKYPRATPSDQSAA